MIKALLVEDNDVDAQLTQDLLSEWSIEEFRITRVKTLGEGLALLSRERFDAVLLDLSLPDAFGLPTVRQVHATSPTIPVVVLSGVSDQSPPAVLVRARVPGLYGPAAGGALLHDRHALATTSQPVRLGRPECDGRPRVDRGEHDDAPRRGSDVRSRSV